MRVKPLLPFFVRFEHPWWLLLLCVTLPLTLWGARWLAGMAPWRRAIAVTLRLLLLFILTSMLAGPHTVRTTNILATILVVDVSDSVQRYFGKEGQDQIRAFIQRSENMGRGLSGARGAEDLLGVVLFDGRAIAVSLPSRRGVETLDLQSRFSDGTDLAGAVRTAWSLVPPDAAGRIILLSDGNQTRGDVLATLNVSAGPVDVVPLEYEVTNEVSIDRVDAPPTSPAGSIVPVRVVLTSSGTTRGYLRLLADDLPVNISNNPQDPTARPITLRPGQNIERIDVPLDEKRVHRFRAIFEPIADDQGTPEGDRVVENNTGEAFTISPSRGVVLLVDGATDSDTSGVPRPLPTALRAAGMEVRTIPAAGMPRDLLGLEEFDCVILDNVPADALAPGVANNLAVYVQDLGGGLVMVGGTESFGAGGWRGSPIEPILPLVLDLPERLLTSEVAIVFVLDNSGSMWRFVAGSTRTQQEIANDAAAAAIRTLERIDQVGVIAFNSQADVIVPMGKNTDAVGASEKVKAIASGGGTNAGPAIALAGEWLEDVTAKSKHIVVLSDGRDMGAAALPNQAEMLKKKGVKLSTISVGDDADTSTMAEMARRGDGASFIVTNPRTLPQIFLKAVRIARAPLVREEPFTPVILSTGSPLTSRINVTPQLLGVTLTQPRNVPTVVNAMTTPKGEPLLAHWQAGLGQVAAFTSDSARWSAPWMSTPIYEQFWKQVVRSVSRAAQTATGMTATLSPLETEGDSTGMRVRLVARDENGKSPVGLTADVTLYSPQGDELAPLTATLTPTAPGIFEAVVPVSNSAAGSYVAIVKPSVDGKPLPPLVAGASLSQGSELRFARTNRELLTSLSHRTGGRLLTLTSPRGENFFVSQSIPPRETLLPLWPLMLWAALTVALVDIANRRLAWDRWVSALFGGARAIAAGTEKATNRLASLRADAQERDAQDNASLALGETEAARIRDEARDRRRAAKLAQHTAQIHTQPPPLQHNSEPATIEDVSGLKNTETKESAAESTRPQAGASGLLAAKRRAAQKFDET